MNPIRIQRKRTKGWRMPENTVFVGRPTRWGNPYTGPDAAQRYRMAVSTFPVDKDTLATWKAYGGSASLLIAIAGRVWPVLEELRGKNLCCWCPLDKPCHSDVLLEIANGEEAEDA